MKGFYSYFRYNKMVNLYMNLISFEMTANCYLLSDRRSNDKFDRNDFWLLNLIIDEV